MVQNYHNRKRELSVLEFQLAQFRGVEEQELIQALCFSHPEGERVQTGRAADKTAKTALTYRKTAEKMNDEWYAFLWSRYQSIQEELAFFEYGVHTLSYPLAEVMTDLVLHQMQWEDLTEKYGVSHTMIANYRKKAVKELNQLYEMRERQLAEYCLS